MAEEATNTEEPVVEVTQEETPEQEKPAEQPQVDPKAQELEQIAREKGWKPEEEYSGDAGTWIDAKEFLLREPLFDTIKRQGKELKGLKKTLESMSSQFQTQVAAQVQLKIKELQNQRREAIREQDVELVEQIDEEIDNQKRAIDQSNQQQQQVPDEVSEWISKNEWFEKDPEMNAWAIAHNRAYIQKNPGDIEGSLDATEKAVKKAFPEKFEAPKAKVGSPPSPVAGGEEPKGKDGKKSWSVARLNEDQKNVYNQMVKTHKVISHEEFFKGLEEIGELE